MRNASYFLLYFPVALVILMVLETCRSDEPRRILWRTLKNFGLLTASLAAGSAVIYLIQRFL